MSDTPRPDGLPEPSQPGQPTGRDRIRLEADPAEVVDSEGGHGLTGQDECEQGSGAELRRCDDAAENVEGSEATADPHPPRCSAYLLRAG